MQRKILQWLLITGSVYFFGVSVAHMAGIKIPAWRIEDEEKDHVD